MDLRLVVLLRHLRPLEPDAFQGIHQVRQDLLRGLARLGMLRLQGKEGPGIGEGGGGVVNGAVGPIHGHDVISGRFAQRDQQVLAGVHRLEAVIKWVIRMDLTGQGIPGVRRVHAVLGIDPVGGPRLAVQEPAAAVLKFSVYLKPDF